MSIFVRRFLHRSRSVDELIEEWKLEHDQAMFAFDLEELVSECIDLGNLSKHAWKSFRDLLLKNPNAPVIEESGRVMQTALTRTLEMFHTVKALVTEASQKGHSIQDAADFELVVNETRKISDKVQVVFMEPDPAAIEESIAAFKRGEYYTSEELLRAAQDGRFPAD